MGSLFDAMVAGAELAEVNYVVAPGRPVVYVHVEGENGFHTCVGEALEEDHVAVFSTWVAKVPAQRASEVAEYLMRVNHDLVIGSFDLDLYEGDVRFKTAAVANGVPAAPEHLATLIAANVLTVDRYLPGLLAVTFGQVPPGDALDRVETFELDAVLHAASERLGG